jgi:hypothetical protein
MSQQIPHTLSPPLAIRGDGSCRSRQPTSSVVIPANDFINEDKLRDRLNSIYDGKVKECYWVMGHWVVEGTGLSKLNEVSSNANHLKSSR